MARVGILAYGSLINDPGLEITTATVDRIDNVLTPFHVEFARKSSTRDGAPTLVPVDSGGNYVQAVVFIIDDRISTKEASDILWRRETHKTNSNDCYSPDEANENQVWIKRLDRSWGLDIVLYTWIKANISPLNSKKLAKLAISSAREAAGVRSKDGISYLIAAKKVGIVTPLMIDYEKEILKKLRVPTLEDAHRLLCPRSG
jgi:cation transport regulator ChaC